MPEIFLYGEEIEEEKKKYYSFISKEKGRKGSILSMFSEELCAGTNPL